MTRPNECPRWVSCNAPICPLDPDWRRAQHLAGESICGLLSEMAKEGGEALLRGCLPLELVDTLSSQGPQVSLRWGRVRRRLARASQTGSRIEAARRLRPRTGVPIVGATREQTAPTEVAASSTGTPIVAAAREVSGKVS